MGLEITSMDEQQAEREVNLARSVGRRLAEESGSISRAVLASRPAERSDAEHRTIMQTLEVPLRDALTADGIRGAVVEFPELVDHADTAAWRRAVNLTSTCVVCGREGHAALDLGTLGQVCPVNRARAS